MKTIDATEGKSTGIALNADGTFTALTLSASRTFKTYRGAVAWLAARGYDANGNKGA